ncbi:MAG TPA: hypothetical protein PLP67_08355 [Methylotenera sp.]|nr:hypothetical protein [Methylotenera sp.]HPM49872.1 hypothetical protein [Methylotenera sp.]
MAIDKVKIMLITIKNFIKVTKTVLVLCLILSCEAKAETHPVLLKYEPEMYSHVYFGMHIEEFKSKLGSRIFECKDSNNKAIGDKGCKVSFKFAGSGISEAVAIFKNGSLNAFVGRINSELYDGINSELSRIYKDQPQIEDREEKKGVFSKKVGNKYSIWSYPNYLMIVSRYDIQKYDENGTNFSLVVESSDANFIDQMRMESKKRSNIEFKMRVAYIDLSQLHLQSDALAKVAENNSPSPLKEINQTNNGNIPIYSGGGYVNGSSNPENPSPSLAISAQNSQPSVASGENTSQKPNTGSGINRSLLSNQINLGSKKDQIEKVSSYCTNKDKFLEDFRKNIKSYAIDEYCLATGLITGVQAESIFLFKDGAVRSILHSVIPADFGKITTLYTDAIGTEPKNKQTYKGAKQVVCFNDEGISDYAEFCKQEGAERYYLMTSYTALTDISNKAALIKLISNKKYFVVNGAEAKSQTTGTLSSQSDVSNSPNSTNGGGNASKNLSSVTPVVEDENSDIPATSTDKVKVEYDNFKKITKFEGKIINDKPNTIFIRAWKSDGKKELVYQIYILSTYGGEWRYYHSAYDSKGNRLDFTSIDRDVECSKYGCTHYEHVGVNVTRKYLLQNKDSGVNIKIDGKAGDTIFTIPGAYISDFLSVAK